MTKRTHITHEEGKAMMQVEARVKELTHKIRTFLPGTALEGMPYPQVDFNLIGCTAGRAYAKGRVSFNLTLLLENQATFDTTVIHEMAHITVYVLRRLRMISKEPQPHGKEWRQMMRFLGVSDPQRCHHYDTTNSQVRKMRVHPYQCACDSYELTTRIHNKILKGATYRCRRCKQTLVHKG